MQKRILHAETNPMTFILVKISTTISGYGSKNYVSYSNRSLQNHNRNFYLNSKNIA